MLPAKYDLLYAQMHTRKYTTATYKPSDSVDKLRREDYVDFAKKGVVGASIYHEAIALTSVHEGNLATRYTVDITFTLEHPETHEMLTLNVPREKVTVIRSLAPRDTPFVYVDIDKEINEPYYEIHVGALLDTEYANINLLYPTQEN